MHPLLAPAPISHSEAAERCAKHLRSRARQFVLVKPLAGENHEHANAVLAYAEALFAAVEIPGPAARGRALQELSEELENVLAGRPQTALGHALSATIRLKELGAPPFRGPLEELRLTPPSQPSSHGAPLPLGKRSEAPDRSEARKAISKRAHARFQRRGWERPGVGTR